jgi:hypothetical protein
MSKIVTKHNGGFFSCCTQRLIEIVNYTNLHGQLPDIVDSSEQFLYYKSKPSENLIPVYFEDYNNIPVNLNLPASFSTDGREMQYSPYRSINFYLLNPFIQKYFSPSKVVQNWVDVFTSKYQLDYNNLCGVFYRGNDKSRETTIAPYNEFIFKAQQILDKNPGIKFLVQPDETEFLETFTAAFPDRCIWFEETPHMKSKSSCIFYELPTNKKTEHGSTFMAATICLSKCNHLITHSGNGGNWAILYRGNTDNVYQWLIDGWIDSYKIDIQGDNEVIKSYIQSNVPFTVCRMDLVTIRWIDWHIRGGLCDWMYTENMAIEPKTLEDIFVENGLDAQSLPVFLDAYITSLKSANIQVRWSKYLPVEHDNVYSTYSPTSSKLCSEVLFPHLNTDFWSKYLENKKVLVIHIFKDTVDYQYKQRDNIWDNDHLGKIPKMELITYRPIWTGSGNGKSWVENYQKMKEDVLSIDFDIALVCNAFYGIPLLDEIKKSGRSAIYVGGELQLLFGIKGARWDTREEVTKMYNEYWIRSIDEKPKDWNTDKTDNGCYW